MLPLHAGAPSRVLLAYAPAEVLTEVLDGGLQPLTPETPTEDVLRDGLAEILRTGSATSQGELVSGSVAVAVPILGDDGIVASLGVVGPQIRCGLAWQARARRLLASAAETIASVLAEDPLP
jgi:DNA-binding IclR family transcriptional regulator